MSDSKDQSSDMPPDRSKQAYGLTNMQPLGESLREHPIGWPLLFIGVNVAMWALGFFDPIIRRFQ